MKGNQALIEGRTPYLTMDPIFGTWHNFTDDNNDNPQGCERHYPVFAPS